MNIIKSWDYRGYILVSVCALLHISMLLINIYGVRMIHSDGASVLILERFSKKIEAKEYTRAETVAKIDSLVKTEKLFVSGAEGLEKVNYYFIFLSFWFFVGQIYVVRKLADNRER